MTENLQISLRDRLLREREALLDLSTRNRLLNTPLRTRNVRNIEIVDEKAAEVFRILADGKSMTFLPGVQLSQDERAEFEVDDNETGGIPQPDDSETTDERGVAARHTDNRLQTRLTSQGLQKRLFDIWYDARTLEEEQGVNILYFAMGMLRWYEADNSDVVRHAPLVLLPVLLERSSAADRFHLKGRKEPPSPNITLQAKLKAEFGILIPEFGDEDDVDLAEYMASIAETVSKKERWEVLPDCMVLGFFSFSKFLMYRDLDPENWPEAAEIDKHPLISALLRDGFPETDPLVPDDGGIDDAIPPLELNHVVDADSSQAVAIAEAAGGRTLVVKGPPGTGKSQTITNIIAASVAKGRKVLFVAEKMAALDVVHRRLRQAGLGPMTLELHSNKVNKRSVLEELKRTKDAPPRGVRGDASVIQRLGDTTLQLNEFAQRLHTPLNPCGLSPYQIIGRLVGTYDKASSVDFSLSGAETWTRRDYIERQEIIAEICDRLLDLGAPARHPWRGVGRDALDPAETDQLLKRLNALRQLIESAQAGASVATNVLGAPSANSVNGVRENLRWLEDVCSMPSNVDVTALGHNAWDQNRQLLRQAIKAGRVWHDLKQEVAQLANDVGLGSDLSDIRTSLVTQGGSLFRFLNSHYRAHIALLRSYLRVKLPSDQQGRVQLVDKIIAAQRAREAFNAIGEEVKAFGNCWREEESAWDVLDGILNWREGCVPLPNEAWQKIGAIDLGAVKSSTDALQKDVSSLVQGLSDLISGLNLDVERAFGVKAVEECPLAVLVERFVEWKREYESLSKFIAFSARCRFLKGLGCSSIAEAVLDGSLERVSLSSAFERAYSDVLRGELFKVWPALRSFDGQSHSRLVEVFRQLDRDRIELAKEHIAALHSEQRPKAQGGLGPLGVLNAELAKKRAHLPLRVLLDRAGPAIQQLKPVFMMSPLSVAQYLKAGGLKFDMLVMDEASQIEPVDALGAIARVDQLVVVGDERQLPPTSFFRKLTGDDEKEEVDESISIQAKDAESILDLCLAKGAPHRMLNWHYRSKHQSLIAVSNREFYENRLYIVPSPYDAIAGMGLKFHLLRDSSYDRGGTRTNVAEAKAVAEAVMRHAAETPELSLGVATFSVAQRQAILKELELLRRKQQSSEDFFSPGSLEPFFVKNLENIQGDERDVIFISVGYGKTEQGYLAHGFGPLSSDGGERRLNVLISRAKLRCEVFSNFSGADIDLERTRAKGVAALKLFLTFAETGKFGLGDDVGGEHDSEFEAQVCQRLRGLGYDVKAQIGASGFRVDLAVADPDKPGRFVLGIECDGAQYHSSRSARDRDRLRQQVLEAHGWIIHRIWSTDWYLRPSDELRKLEAAISAAKLEWRERDEKSAYRPKAVPLTFDYAVIDEDTSSVTAIVSDVDCSAAPVPPLYYKEASISVNRSLEPHEVAVGEMASYVAKIVEVEGPVHVDEIINRIRTLWGLHRAGSRIRNAVTYAARIAVQRGLIVGNEFYSVPGQAVAVRDRSQVTSTTLRKPEMLPPIEIETALITLIDANFGAKEDELVLAVARALGFAATSVQLRQVIQGQIQSLREKGIIDKREDFLVRAGSSQPVGAS